MNRPCPIERPRARTTTRFSSVCSSKWAALALTLCALTSPQVARAGERRLTDQQISELEDLATRGQAACESKRFSACHTLFTQAQAMLPWPPHEYYLGEALVGMGKLLEGIAAWRQMLANNVAPTDPVVADAVELAKQRLADVEASVPSVLFQVPNEHLGKVNIQLDGRLIASTEIEQQLQLDPGEHSIQLSQPGYAAKRHKLTLAPGVHQRLLVALEALPAPGQQLPPEPATSWRVPVGWTLTGVGAGAMIGSLALYLNKESLNRALEQECSFAKDCVGLKRSEFDQRTDEIVQRTVWSNVLLFGGAGLSLLGVSTLIWNEVEGPEPPPKLSLVTGPGFSALRLDGRF